MDKKVETLKAHPLASIFPMLSDEALDDLAEDIKTTGLRLPILIDAEEQVVDGRNRQEACKRADVEPRFERVPDGTNILSLIVSLNVKRRNLNASQRAIAAAEAWAQAEAEGKVQKQGGPRQKSQSVIIADPAKHFGKLFGVGENYVRAAKELLAEPRAVEKVKGGKVALQDAHKAMVLALGQEAQDERKLRTLQRERLDLAEKVAAETMTLDQAVKQAADDEKERKQQRWAATVTLIRTVEETDRSLEFIEDTVRSFDRGVEKEKGGEPVTRERLQRCSDYLAALASAWEDDDEVA